MGMPRDLIYSRVSSRLRRLCATAFSSQTVTGPFATEVFPLDIPMGQMADIGMPVGMTIAGRGYSDELLLDIAALFHAATEPIGRPPLTPPIPESTLVSRETRKASGKSPAAHSTPRCS